MSILHKIRNRQGELVEKKITPIKAIREKCMDCCCWQINEVRECLSEECALHPFRMGKTGTHANKGRVLSEEQKKLLQESLLKARNSKNAKV